jgi:hypothetical protein
MNVKGDSSDPNVPCVLGESPQSEGVRGVSHSPHGAVVGINDWADPNVPGSGGNGGWFESKNGEGVRGTSNNPNHGGVVGVNTGKGIAVYGTSADSVGVWGTSVSYEGVHAETQSKTTAAMAAYQMNAESGTAAFFAKHKGNRTAGRFEGDLEVTGDIRLDGPGSDCAEEFDVFGTEVLEPGTVVVVGEHGSLAPCTRAYDKRVIGVISGAGTYRPAIVLDKRTEGGNRSPVALLGKVYCKVDANSAAVEIGDLLATSDTPGHAMKVVDPLKGFGSVIGKALRPLKQGQGMIPILVALQ